MPIEFTLAERSAASKLIALALAEDLDATGDLTSRALIEESSQAEVNVVARAAGVLAGAPVAAIVFEEIDPHVRWRTFLPDGSALAPGAVVASVSGRLAALLAGERTALNFLTHLSGVATLTRQFVDRVAGTRAAILDTRKTLPGYRALEKYAVRAGGGANHRMGLYDGCLIKDNHLAAWSATATGGSIADAVRTARSRIPADIPVEVEVDTLDQLADALRGKPDLVLLDNMTVPMLRDAVALRDRQGAGIVLEASGGVNLANVAEIAATGVERISVGALTHSAAALDLAFDWGKLLG